MSRFINDDWVQEHGGRQALLPSNRVLVVDNERDVVDAQALLLEALGQHVRRAYGGAAAVAIAAEVRPNLVLLDVQMPDLDGFEVAARLRSLAPPLHALIVAHTGTHWPDYRAPDDAAAFDGYLRKPAALGEIVALLRHAHAPTSAPHPPAEPARGHSGAPRPAGAARPPTGAGSGASRRG